MPFSKERRTTLFLFVLSFILRLYMATRDAFLHDWDERFHALVARNMMDHPLTPMLRKVTLMPYNKFDWCCNSVWLHKQPLFMWQMALSMKIFGVSEFAIRYPSVLMGALMTVMIYKLAKLVLKNEYTALAAALMMCFCNYQLELISGFNGTDHNDVAFGFYVLGSIYFYARYTEDKRLLFALLTGLCAGLAVMNKWLTGMIIFMAWGVNILLRIKDKGVRNEIAHLALAIAICVVVFLPWQLYILHTFPEVARYEYAYNTRHITEVIEDHKGSVFFYLAKFPLYYGIAGSLLIPVGLWQLFATARKDSFKKTALINTTVLIFTVLMLFFSVVVKTKWVPYAFAVAPIGLIFAAAGLSFVTEKLKLNKGLSIAVLVPTLIFILRPWDIAKAHSANDSSRLARIHNAQVYKDVKQTLPNNISLVLNTKNFDDLDLMFYHNDITAYSWCLNDHVLDSLKQANIPIGIYMDHGQYTIPPSLSLYKNVFVIRSELW